jgi:hypothetical protein
MLRYLVLGNFWLACGVLLLLGCGYATGDHDSYALFGHGTIDPWLYRQSVGVAFASAALFLAAWWRTLVSSELKRLQGKLAKAAEEIRKHNADYHYVTPAEVLADLEG